MEIESKYNFTKLRPRSAYVSHGHTNAFRIRSDDSEVGAS